MGFQPAQIQQPAPANPLATAAQAMNVESGMLQNRLARRQLAQQPQRKPWGAEQIKLLRDVSGKLSAEYETYKDRPDAAQLWQQRSQGALQMMNQMGVDTSQMNLTPQTAAQFVTDVDQKWGAPTAGVGPAGQAGMFQVDPRTGQARRVEGMAPVPKAPPTGPTAAERQAGKAFDQEAKLRDKFAGQSKDYIKVRDAQQRILASAEDPSAAGDLALIFNYMKVLDPSSTVREGEFATAQNAAGVGQRVMAQYNSIMRGERMTPVQRADFVKRAKMLYNRQEKSHKPN